RRRDRGRIVAAGRLPGGCGSETREFLGPREYSPLMAQPPGPPAERHWPGLRPAPTAHASPAPVPALARTAPIQESRFHRNKRRQPAPQPLTSLPKENVFSSWLWILSDSSQFSRVEVES